MRLIADENTSMSISGAANTTALERQHRSHAVRDDVDAAGGRGRHNGREHAFEVVAGEHRAFAVIGLVEQPRLWKGQENSIVRPRNLIASERRAALSAAFSNV